jgi:hypothetical protein
MAGRSYWIPGSYATTLSENQNSFLRPLKNKGFKEERVTKIGLYAIGKSTTLESNKSLQRCLRCCTRLGLRRWRKTTLALRDRLETTLETMRSERHILPAMMWCPHCQARHRSAPPKVSVRALILALGRFGMASASEVKALECRWNTYRNRHQLDRYGMKE